MLDLTWPSYFISAVVLYYGLLLLIAKTARHVVAIGDETGPSFVLVVPARNEELVIEETIENLASLDYHDLRVLVMNDGSIDRTSQIAHGLASEAEGRVVVCDRHPTEAGRGKSDVLNHAARFITEALAGRDPRFPEWQQGDVVVGIVDADGRLEPDSLRVVAPYFTDLSVGSVQIGVRIGNAAAGLLTRLQDMEFVGFTYLVQVARDHLGSSGLGGNGQFTRLTALASIGPVPWTPTALTEDLELGLSLVELGWRTRFCPDTFVSQQGLTKWRPLLRQRTRWIHGHYQCWKHVPRLLLARRVAWRARLDLITYLLLVVTVVVVTFNLVVSVLSIAGVVTAENNFLAFISDDYLRSILAELFALFPLIIFLHTYQRHSGRPFAWYELPAYGIAFTAYSYVWVISTARAWARLITRRGSWVKTPRVAMAAPRARSVS